MPSTSSSIFARGSFAFIRCRSVARPGGGSIRTRCRGMPPRRSIASASVSTFDVRFCLAISRILRRWFSVVVPLLAALLHDDYHDHPADEQSGEQGQDDQLLDTEADECEHDGIS